MIYVVYGNEYFLLRKECNNIIKLSKMQNIINIDLLDDDFNVLFDEVMYNGIFNEKKLIIVNNFTFKLNESENKKFELIMDNINDNVLLIKCIDNTLDERKNIIKRIKKDFKVLEFKKLDRFALNDSIFNIFKEEGFKISNDLVKKIINKCGYNNYSLDNGYIFNEVNKLIIYKGKDKKISESDIENIISKNMENEIFNFTNIVLNKNKNEIFNELKIVMSLDIDPFLIINNLSKQYRTLLQIKILYETENEEMIAKKLGISSYIVKVQSKNIYLYTKEEICDILHKLFDIDSIMKSQSVDGYKIIERFLLNL